MLYHLHELKHAMTTPMRHQAEWTKAIMENPWNPLSHTQMGRTIAAGAEMMERSTRRFGKPAFDLPETVIDGKKVAVTEKIMAEQPFGRLINFQRDTKRKDPKILLAAPMSGHYATLLCGTVKALLPHHDVYITDWEDAGEVPLSEGKFDLDDFIAYLRHFMSVLGPDTHIIAVCQPTVPVLAAVSLMASDNDPNQPLTMTLMGGPVDTRISKTEVTELAETRDISWFEKSVVCTVPFFRGGSFRKVYPGFLQLGGFMSMNLDKHVGSYMEFYQHLVDGDGESAEMHRKFYDEYLSVMDIPGEFYLQTVETVFQTHALPRRLMKWVDPETKDIKDVHPQDINKTALLTIEGEKDDISARGQTTAAHELCYSIPQNKQFHHFQLGCGHYGIFNGGRWREHIMPTIRKFIRAHDTGKSPVPKKDLKSVPEVTLSRYNRDTHGIAAVRRWLRDNQEQHFKDNED